MRRRLQCLTVAWAFRRWYAALGLYVGPAKWSAIHFISGGKNPHYSEKYGTYQSYFVRVWRVQAEINLRPFLEDHRGPVFRAVRAAA